MGTVLGISLHDLFDGSSVVCTETLVASCFFVQDTIRFWPLAVTMLGMSFRDPVVVTRVVRLVRLP